MEGDRPSELEPDLSKLAPEVAAYARYLDSFSRRTVLDIPGYYVAGGDSDFDVAVMQPIIDLTKGIDEDTDLLAHLELMIQQKNPAIEALFGRRAIEASSEQGTEPPN